MINLRGLNCHIKKMTFRMPTIKDVSQSIRRRDWASTIDLKDAYLHVPIAKDHRRFVRFWWDGKSFQFRRLPLGLSFAPRTFTQLTLPTVTLCRARGIRLIAYLDDFLVLAGRSCTDIPIWCWIFWTRRDSRGTLKNVTSHPGRDSTIWVFNGIPGSFVSFSLRTRS